MKVELCGLPGSGKSHLAAVLGQHLPRTGIACVDLAAFAERKSRARWSLRRLLGGKRADLMSSRQTRFLVSALDHFLAGNRAFFSAYLDALHAREMPDAVRSAVFESFLMSCSRQGGFARREAGLGWVVGLEEEGPIHRILTLFGYEGKTGGDEAGIDRIAGLAPAPDLLIWTRCTPETAIARMKQRTGKTVTGRLSRFERADWPEILACGDRVLEIVCQALSARGANVLTLDSEAPIEPDTVVARIVTASDGQRLTKNGPS